MKYFLMTRCSGKTSVHTFDDQSSLNESIVAHINGGFRESGRALDDKYTTSNDKYYAVVQGIQVATVVNSVEVK
jgi:hypothetical protein